MFLLVWSLPLLLLVATGRSQEALQILQMEGLHQAVNIARPHFRFLFRSLFWQFGISDNLGSATGCCNAENAVSHSQTILSVCVWRWLFNTADGSLAILLWNHQQSQHQHFRHPARGGLCGEETLPLDGPGGTDSEEAQNCGQD